MDGFRDTAGRVVDWIDRPRTEGEEGGGREGRKGPVLRCWPQANIGYI